MHKSASVYVSAYLHKDYNYLANTHQDQILFVVIKERDFVSKVVKILFPKIFKGLRGEFEGNNDIKYILWKGKFMLAENTWKVIDLRQENILNFLKR